MKTIHLHRDAPAKPEPGQPCNGCGVCCAAETCPMAMFIFRRLKGPCPALEWEKTGNHYRCGLLQSPATYLPWLPDRPWLRRLLSRWIAAGKGCDSDYEAISPETPAPPDRKQS